jgi:hypothetical protein
LSVTDRAFLLSPFLLSLTCSYQHKVTQQESLAKELRKQQKHLKQNETGDIRQKKMFADLQKLLECKLKIKVQEQMSEPAPAAVARPGGVGQGYADISGFGGADVMTIE